MYGQLAADSATKRLESDLSNHSDTFQSFANTTTKPRALLDKIYTYLLNYLYNYELRYPPYEEVNYSSLGHCNVQKMANFKTSICHSELRKTPSKLFQ